MTTGKKIGIGFITAIIIVIIFFLICAAINKFDEKYTKTYETSDTCEYGYWNNHFEFEMDSIKEKLYVFPEKVSSNENVVNYYYTSKVDSSSIDSGIIFAQIKYTEKEYQEEITRLSNIECEIQVDGNPLKNKVDYSEDLFAIPAYIAIYNCNDSFEYALVDEKESTIIYVYIHKMIPDDRQVVDEYMPKTIAREHLFDGNSWENKNIYFAKNKSGDYVSNESNGHIVIPLN